MCNLLSKFHDVTFARAPLPKLLSQQNAVRMPAVCSKSPRDNELSIAEERAQILAYKSVGLTDRECALKLQKSERWVWKWTKNVEEEGNVRDRARCRRPTQINGRVTKAVSGMKYKRGKSTRKMEKHLKGMGDDISHTTIHKYLRND